MSTARKNANVLWSYFEKDDAVKKAKCSLCKYILSYKSTTANLRKHLKRKHIGSYTSLIEEENIPDHLKPRDEPAPPRQNFIQASSVPSSSKALVSPQFQKGQSKQKMHAKRKISPRQMDILLEFAESNRDIALGRLIGGPLGYQATRQAWVSVAKKLNAVAGGYKKKPEQWRRYWVDFKAKTKSKAANSRRKASATGGRPRRPLAHIEERVLAIISTVAVEDLPGVIPTEGTQRTVTSETVPASRRTTSAMPHSSPYPIISPEPPMDVEWLEEEVPSPLGVQFHEPSSSNLHLPDTDPLTTHIQSNNQPEVASLREERPPVHLTQPTQRTRSHRQINKCKDEWAILRNAFASALKRRRYKKSGEAAAALVPWKHEESMGFLLPYMECRDTKTNVMPTQESPPTEDSLDESLPASPSPSTRSQSQSSSSRGKTNHEPKLQELYDLMKSFQDLRRQKQNARQDMDETDLFFLSMSKEVKTLPKLDQTKIKLDLHTAISQAVIRQLEHQSTSQHQSSTYIQTTADVQSPTYNQSTTHAQSPTYIKLSSFPTTSRSQKHAVSNSDDSKRFIQSIPQHQSSTYIQTPADVQSPTYIQSPIHAQSPTYIKLSSFPSRLNSKPVVSDDLKAYYDSINFNDDELENDG